MSGQVCKCPILARIFSAEPNSQCTRIAVFAQLLPNFGTEAQVKWQNLAEAFVAVAKKNRSEVCCFDAASQRQRPTNRYSG